VKERLLDVLRARVDAEARGFVPGFLRRLLAIRERPMRAYVLADRLRRSDAHLALGILSQVLRRALARDPTAQELLLDLTLTRPLADTLGYANARRVYELARLRGIVSVGQLFLSPETLAARSEAPGAEKKADNDKLPDESLGWRKALARGRNRLKMDRLLFDRNPQVIGLLLQNPRFTERDAVRVAAMRPANPDVLEVVFQSDRWISRYRVKVALACNPWTPVDIALACVPHLMQPQLEYVAGAATLHERVREAARELLRQRRQAPSEAGPPVLRVGPGGAIVRELSGGEADADLDVAGLAEALENWSAGEVLMDEAGADAGEAEEDEASPGSGEFPLDSE
jgi:hypothetical protein